VRARCRRRSRSRIGGSCGAARRGGGSRFKAVAVDRPELGERQPEGRVDAGVLAGRVRSATVRSSVESETGTPRRNSSASGCDARSGTMPACTLLVGTGPESRREPAAPPGVPDRRPPACRVRCATARPRAPEGPGSAAHSPAWQVIPRPPARAASNAAAWRSGSGNAASGPAQSKPVSRHQGSESTLGHRPFRSGACERSATAMRRTVMPVFAAPLWRPRRPPRSRP